MLFFSVLFLALWSRHTVHAEQDVLASLERNELSSDVAVRRDGFLIFNEVNSLLRQWGNALTPNGFSVALVSVPANTLFYHARADTKELPSPKWFAFDPEMSYGIYGGRQNTSVYLHTYQTTASLDKLLYFNGLSAALTNTTLDTQDLAVPPAPSDCPALAKIFADYARAKRLCAWAGERGIEGFVRNNIGFELLWCNMQDARIKLVRSVDVTSWADRMDDHSSIRGSDEAKERNCWFPPSSLPKNFIVFARYASWEWIRSASYRYDGPGESRVVLRSGWFITARGLEAGSSAAARVADLAPDAVEAWKVGLNVMIHQVVQQKNKNSGIDWRALTDSIVNRYGDRLQELSALLRLAQTKSSINSLAQIKHSYRLTASLILPFFDRSASPEEQIKLCTFSILPKVNQLNEYERKIWIAIVHVHRSICTVFLDVHSGLSGLQSSSPGQASSLMALSTRVDGLIAQLNWSTWIRCPEVCSWGQVCYVPVWPFSLNGGPWGLPEEPRCVGAWPEL